MAPQDLVIKLVLFSVKLELDCMSTVAGKTHTLYGQEDPGWKLFIDY